MAPNSQAEIAFAGERLRDVVPASHAICSKLCTEAKAKGTEQVVIGYPWALGDTYEELIQSLSRLADAELVLHIGARKDWPRQN